MSAVRVRGAIAALTLLAMPGFALAESKTITYTILKEGDPIGKETYVVDRDLWYDADGVLAKTTSRRRGFGIAIVRDN